MKNKISFLVGLSFLIFSTCTKSELSNELTSEIPVTPNAIEIDIDENGVVDYRIKYSSVQVEGLTISGGIVGVLEPYGENEILNKRQGDDLFLRNLEEVTKNVSEPLFWSSTSIVSIVAIYNHSPTNEWRTKWDISSDMDFPSYFIGVNMINDDVSQLGWIELEINTTNGNISISDKGLL